MQSASPDLAIIIPGNCPAECSSVSPSRAHWLTSRNSCLMDEPFASVDAQTRADLEDLVAAVRARFGITIVFITHDIDEAVYLSDRVIVLSKSPTTVLDRIAIELPRPRDQIATKALPQFVAKRSAIARLIRRPTSEISRESLLAGATAQPNDSKLGIESLPNVEAIRRHASPSPAYDVVIVGAGFAGLYSLHRFRGLGLQGAGIRGCQGYWRNVVLEPISRCAMRHRKHAVLVFVFR